MTKTLGLFLTLGTLLAGVAHAQSDGTAPPSATPPAATTTSPPPADTTPAPAPSPTTPAATTPTPPPPAAQPTVIVVQQQPAASTEPEKPKRSPWAPIPTDDESVHYALGLRARALFVPGWLLAPFVQQYKELQSYDVGLEFTRRRGTLDIVLSLDWGNYTPPDGNWLGNGKQPELDTHYVQVRGLNVLSLDIAFLWQHDIFSWLAITIGGGVGLGYVFGDVYTINSSSMYCNTTNTGDSSKCFPSWKNNADPANNPTPTYKDPATGMTVEVGDIKPGDPSFQAKLDATAQAQAQCLINQKSNPSLDCRDTANHPYYHASTDKPPVIPIINFIIGFRIKVFRHLNLNVNGGFRNGWVVGGGPEIVF